MHLIKYSKTYDMFIFIKLQVNELVTCYLIINFVLTTLFQFENGHDVLSEFMVASFSSREGVER